MVTPLATGPGCIIQSDFGVIIGNLEVVAIEGTDLVHYWLELANPVEGWHRALTITGNAAGAGCIIQSDFGSSSHGNLEVVVQEGPNLVHYWHDSSAAHSPWNGPTVIHQADSAGCFFQSDYAPLFRSGNFELVFRRGAALMHCFRDNDSAGFPWSLPQPITAAARRVSGPACALQGSWGSGDHRNFELLAAEGAAVVQYYRANDRPDLKWFSTVTVVDGMFTFRSDFNKNLATLEFYPVFGGSNVADLALSGPLQDNGTVGGIAGPNGTPWFQIEGGDGQAAFYLSGQSLKFPGKLAAGYSVVDLNNDTEDDHVTDIGIKSAHLQLDTQRLVLDDHGKGSGVIPLTLPKPGVVPIPDPAKGLRRGSGPRFLFELVRSPENFPKGMMLAALAAQGQDLFALFVGRDLVDPRPNAADMSWKLDMYWEFQHSFTKAKNVNAVASADGLAAIVELTMAAPSKFVSAPGPNFSRLDLATDSVTDMPTMAGSGKAQSIAIVSADEAYAAVTFTPAALFVPKTEQQIMCWNGSQWIIRGQPPLSPGEGSLISVAVDPTQTPATIFAATSSKVYVSRDFVTHLGSRFQRLAEGLVRP